MLLGLIAAVPALGAERVVVLASDDNAAGERRLVKAVRRAIAKRPGIRLASRAAQARMLDPNVEIEPLLRSARKHLRKAEVHFRAFDLGRAKRSVERANAALEPWSGRPETRDLERTIGGMMVSIAHAQRDEAQVDWALAAYARRFDAPPDQLWPPALAARLAALRTGRTATLSVRTTPAGAVFIDGKAVGQSPVFVEQLADGPHRLLVRAPGYLELDVPVTVGSASPAAVDVALREDLAARLRRVQGASEVDRALISLVLERAASAKIDAVVLAVRGADHGVTLFRLTGGTPAPTAVVVVAPGGDLATSARQLFAVSPAAADSSDDAAWAVVGGAAGLAAAGAGAVLRLHAAGRRARLDSMAGALTQVQAFDLRDAAEREAIGGAVLIGVGSAAVVGVVGWLLLQVLPEAQE